MKDVASYIVTFCLFRPFFLGKKGGRRASGAPRQLVRQIFNPVSRRALCGLLVSSRRVHGDVEVLGYRAVLREVGGDRRLRSMLGVADEPMSTPTVFLTFVHFLANVERPVLRCIEAKFCE